MKKFIKFAMDKVKTFSVWDFGVFKFCLVSFGILLGAYFARFFLSYITVIWVIFILAYAYMFYRVFSKKVK